MKLIKKVEDLIEEVNKLDKLPEQKKEDFTDKYALVVGLVKIDGVGAELFGTHVGQQGVLTAMLDHMRQEHIMRMEKDETSN